MKRRYFRGAVAVSIFAGITFAQNENVQQLPTWQDEIAKGLVPYHQLTVDDFSIDDRAHPEAGFWVKPFIDPHYHFHLKPAYGGFVYAYVDQWIVFSGFDKNESSRKGSMRDMKAELPYAQAILDLNELYARQLAAITPGDLPSGRGASFGQAANDLAFKIKLFCQETYGRIQGEYAAFVAATANGQNKGKVRELAAEIRKRLNSLPNPTASPAVTTPNPGGTASMTSPVAPSATARPK